MDNIIINLFPEPINLGLQLFVTLILFLGVKRYLWGPITDLVEARKQIIVSELDEAKKANEQANFFKEQAETDLGQAKTEAREYVEVAKRNAEKVKVEIIEDARTEADRLKAQADLDIAQEIAEAREDVKKEIVNVAFELASKVVEKEINDGDHDKLVSDFISEVH
jgi:F-type H+-transporting ATPase subunit b